MTLRHHIDVETSLALPYMANCAKVMSKHDYENIKELGNPDMLQGRDEVVLAMLYIQNAHTLYVP